MHMVKVQLEVLMHYLPEEINVVKVHKWEQKWRTQRQKTKLSDKSGQYDSDIIPYTVLFSEMFDNVGGD